jgi:hypothetical protein
LTQPQHFTPTFYKSKDTILKKLTLTLIAFAALSTAAFASNRDVTAPTGAQDVMQNGNTATNALAIPDHHGRKLTNFERMMKQSEEGGEDRGKTKSQPAA